jgi:hypothetical protein
MLRHLSHLNARKYKYFTRTSNMLLVCLLLVVFVTVARPSITAWAKKGPTIKLNITYGPPSALVNASGTGFGLSETVNISFDSTSLSSATTDTSGSFSGTLTIPNSALPGNHTISATGVTSGSMAQKTFLVQTSWPEFGYSGWHSHYNPHENVINTTNVSSLVVLAGWPVKTGSVINSSPTVYNGNIYIGSCDRKLYAFNATTGASAWSSPAVTGGSIESSPAVWNGSIYVGSDDGKLYAISVQTGATLWTATTGSQIVSSPTIAIVSSPTVVNGVVYVGSQDTKLYAFTHQGS